MALEVFFPQDVKNALLAAEQASGAALQATSNGDDDPFVAGYQAGCWATLTTLALAFGLLPAGGHRHDFDGPNPGLAFLVTKIGSGR